MRYRLIIEDGGECGVCFNYLAVAIIDWDFRASPFLYREVSFLFVFFFL